VRRQGRVCAVGLVLFRILFWRPWVGSQQGTPMWLGCLTWACPTISSLPLATTSSRSSPFAHRLTDPIPRPFPITRSGAPRGGDSGPWNANHAQAADNVPLYSSQPSPEFPGTQSASTKAKVEAGKSDKLTGSAEPSPTSWAQGWSTPSRRQIRA